MTDTYPEVTRRKPGPKPKVLQPADPVVEAPSSADLTTVRASPMDSAPKDGRPLWLTANGSTWVRAQWRKTRAFDWKAAAESPKMRRFVPTGFWVFQATVNRIPWEPTGWALLVE